jgi:hypothetical protein
MAKDIPAFYLFGYIYIYKRMSAILTAEHVQQRWNRTNDCGQFLGTLGDIPVTNYLFFHPGFNIQGGHRRAVYFAQNGPASFVFYCEQPKTNRRTREKRSLFFVSDIEGISVSTNSGRMSGEEWDQAKGMVGLRSVTFQVPSGKFLFRVKGGPLLPTYSDDLSDFISKVVRARSAGGLPVSRESTTEDKIRAFVRDDHMTRLGQQRRNAREEEIARLEELLKDAPGDRKAALERDLDRERSRESAPLQTPPVAPFTNEEVAQFYDNRPGVESTMPAAPYTYNQARISREIPEGKRLKDGVSSPSRASQIIDADTQRAFLSRQTEPGVNDQRLELPAGGRRTRRRMHRRGKVVRAVATRKRRKSKKRKHKSRRRVSRRL